MTVTPYPIRYDPSDRAASHDNSGTEEASEVTQLLEAAGIPCCIVGVRALRYFGAGRIADEWDVCVPDEKLEDACCLFESAPLKERFECVASPRQYPRSLRYLFPTFQLKGVQFYFLLAPASDSFCDPRPQFCERSSMGIPYPQDVHFARSLLVQQNDADLADFIDAHNSTLEWGESNLNFAELQAEGTAYAIRKNKLLRADSRYCSALNPDRDFATAWAREVDDKDSRIEPIKQGRYITRWRSKARPVDPRHHDPRGRNRPKGSSQMPNTEDGPKRPPALQAGRCQTYQPIHYASDDEDEEFPIDELEDLEARAEDADPVQQTLALAHVAAVFDKNGVLYGTIGGFNFWTGGSDRRTTDIDIAVHRTPSMARILDLFNDDPVMTRPARPMQWVSGTARIFVTMGGGQPVQFDLVRQGADGLGMAIDLNVAVERLPLRSLPGASASANFFRVRYLVHSKLRAFMVRGARKDYTDLEFACTDRDMAPQVREVAEHFDIAWRRTFLDAVLQENNNPGAEAAVRWAFRLEARQGDGQNQRGRGGQ